MKNSNYWYARGYYDGRAHGEQSRPEYISEEAKRSYISGYNRGVIDFITIQEEQGGEA